MNSKIQDQLNIVIAPSQAVIDAANSIPALVDEAEQAKYDAGFAAGEVQGIEKGKAMIQVGDASNPDAIYTQAQLSAAVSAGMEQQKTEDALVISEKEAQLSTATFRIDTLTQQFDAYKVSSAEDQKSAVAAKQSEMLADFINAEIDNAAVIAKYKA